MTASRYPAVETLLLFKAAARDEPYVYTEKGQRQSTLYKAHIEKARQMGRRPLQPGHFGNVVRDPRYQAASDRHGPLEGFATTSGAVLGAAAGAVGGIAGSHFLKMPIEATMFAPSAGAIAGAMAGRALSGAPGHMRKEWGVAVERNRPGAGGGPRVPHVDPRPFLKSDRPIDKDYGQYVMDEDHPVDRQHYGRAVADDEYVQRSEMIGGQEGKNRATMGHAAAIGAATGIYGGLAAATHLPGAAGAALGVGLPLAGLVAGRMAGKSMSIETGDRDAELRAAIARTAKAAAIPEDERDRPMELISGGAISGIGASVATGEDVKKNLTGRETFHHGTSVEGKKNIMEHGIQSKYTGEAGSVTEVMKHNPMTRGSFEAAKTKVYTSPSKPFAMQYAYQNRLAEAKPGTSRAGLVQKAETEMVADMPRLALHGAVGQLPKDIDDRMVRVSIPKWKPEWKGRETSNPEFDAMFGADSAQAKNLGRGTFEGDIGPENVVGSRHYKKLDFNEVKSFAKAHPERIAKGLGIAALGGAAVAFGAHRMYNAIKQDEPKAV